MIMTYVVGNSHLTMGNFTQYISHKRTPPQFWLKSERSAATSPSARLLFRTLLTAPRFKKVTSKRDHIMPAFQADCTVVIKAVRASQVEDVARCVVQTSGFVSKKIREDSSPEFNEAKTIFCNYQSSLHAAKALEVISFECTRQSWGEGLTRAATKDKLHTISRQKKRNFPLFVNGLSDARPEDLQLELQELYSKYGKCWVIAKPDANFNLYALVYFSEFDSALNTLNDSHGVKYNGIILRPFAAYDTAWALHVWNELKNTDKLSFREVTKMAQSGVDTGSGKKFCPKPAEILPPLQQIHHFKIDTEREEITWASLDDTDSLRRFPSKDFAGQPTGLVSLPADSGQSDAAAMSTISVDLAACSPEHPEVLAETTDLGTPDKFVCPIGLEVMRDPVRLSNGKTFDRYHIQEWFRKGNTVCPLTRTHINPFNIEPDTSLKAEIINYQLAKQATVVSAQKPLQQFSQQPQNSICNANSQPRDSGSPIAGTISIEVTNFNGSDGESFESRRTYRLGKFLGGGGMGRVYRAQRQAGAAGDARVYALKICSCLRDGKTERNDREAQNLQRLQHIRHENVVQLFDSGVMSMGGAVVLVMEIVEPGSTLRELLDAPLPLPVCSDLMAQILAGMEAVHMEGIAHRDLKLSNVMVQPQPGGKMRVVIIDFGLSKASEVERDQEYSITLPGQTLGTVAYMSPEQIRGEAGTHDAALASDVWAMGVIFYMMVEGCHPFAFGTTVPPRTEADKAVLIRNIMSVQPPPLRRAPAQSAQEFLNKALERFLNKALQRRMELRFASAMDMRREAAALALIHSECLPQPQSSHILMAAGGPQPEAPGKESEGLQVSEPVLGMDLPSRCERAERVLLGETHSGEAVKQRLARLETEIEAIGVQAGTLKTRIEAIERDWLDTARGTDLPSRCERAEKKLLGETHGGEAVKRRIVRLECEVGCDETGQHSSLRARIEAIEREAG